MAKTGASNDSGTLFNKAYAKRIYEFDGDYDNLRNDLVNLLKESNGKDQSWMPDYCMDPFTCLTIPNRDYSWESRIDICRRLKDYWKIDAEVPDSFISIPVANNMNSVFANGSSKLPDDQDGAAEAEYRRTVDVLWDCFRVFVDYSRGRCSAEDFIEAYDRVHKIKGVGTPKLTICLYWIDSEFYLSLDRPNVNLLKKYGLHPNVNLNSLTGAQYLKFLNDFKRFLAEKEKSLFDFSSEAWESNSDEEDDQWGPSKDVFDPHISEEQWIELLHDPSIFDENSLRIVKQISIMGNASYKELGERFGFDRYGYNGFIIGLCRRIQKATKCENMIANDYRYWPIAFMGKYTRGVYAYKLREELAAAMEKSQDVFYNIEVYNTGYTPTSEKPSDILKPCQLNTILYGPPGTGKTFSSARLAVEIITGKDLDDPFEEYGRLYSEGRIGFVTFHQSYSYEEFIEGLRPETDDEDRIGYKVQDGIFKEFCNKARNSGTKSSSIGLNKSPQIWKVSLNGTGDNEIRRDCLKNGHIRIGWPEYGENITDETAFTNGGKLVLNAFINKMSVGDIVISCYSAQTTDAIGVVASDYRYDPKGGEFPRYRDVKWINIFDVPKDIVALNGGKAMTLASVYKLDIPLSDVLALTDAVDKKEGPSERYVFIIDEINRGNISRILGELITLLEPSKREGSKEAVSVTLPYSKSRFSVPSNVYIIGTMNTADKSLVSLDAALRRRFRFKEMMPDYSLVPDDVEGIDVRRMLETINERIEILYDRDHVIGHSYLMHVETLDDLNSVLEDSIIPLLQEYFMDDFEKIGQVLSMPGKLDEESMFVCRKKCSSPLKNSPAYRYEMIPGPFSKEKYISIYTKQD